MKVEIKTDGYTLDKQTKAYAEKKIQKLTKKLNPHQTESLHVVLTLREDQAKAPDVFEADCLLRLPPREEFIAKETAVNMLAAIDIVESKLERQVKRYKAKNDDSKKDRKNSFARIRKLADREFWGKQN